MSIEKKLVIVAEDETLTRMLAAEVLSDAGFEVLEASNADVALAILKSRSGQVQLLFTDIHMPGSIDGLELAKTVRENWPKVGLVVTSGLHTPRQGELPIGGIFVSKPYDLDSVVAHIDNLTTI